MNTYIQNAREKLGAFFESHAYHGVLAVLIVLSIFSIGHELSTHFQLDGTFNHAVHYFNQLVVLIFVIEIIARLIAHGPSFFKDPWHIFDFVIISVSLVSLGGFFQLFRAVRLFWLLRVFSIFPQFKHIINAIIKAIPHMLSTGVILMVVIYIFALLGVAIFGHDHVDTYGTVWAAMKSISQSVLMEHTWSEQIAVLSKTNEYALWYVLPMIIILNFLMLQMVFGVVISSLIHQRQEDENESKREFLEKWMNNKHTAEEEAKHIAGDTRLLMHEMQKLRDQLMNK